MTHETVDCIGLCCPEPIMITHRIMVTAPSDHMVTVLATDPLSQEDFKSYCKSMGHTFVAVETKDNVYEITIKKN